MLETLKGIELKNKKVAIISHNDLDGAGPIIICDKLFTDYKFFNVSNNAVDKVVKKVLFSPEFEDREVIFITDCSITDLNLCATITKINEQGKRKVFLFDHHDTALWLNVYNWAVVTDEKDSDGDPCVSGTLLFFDYIYNTKEFDSVLTLAQWQFLNLLSKTISNWDTWQWVKHDMKICKDLATLFTKTGMNYFLTKFKYSNDILTTYDEALLKDIQNKEEFIIVPGIKRTAVTMPLTFIYDYIDKENNDALVHVSETRNVKFVSVADAPNDLAEQLYEDGIDYVIIFYSTGTVSVRSRVKDIHLGYWAKTMAGSNGSGGGHDKSAGFSLNSENSWIFKKYVDARYKGV